MKECMTHKETYLAPDLQFFYYVVERGFANSPIRSNTETFSEINQNDFNSQTIGGENYTGEWDNGIEW